MQCQILRKLFAILKQQMLRTIPLILREFADHGPGDGRPVDRRRVLSPVKFHEHGRTQLQQRQHVLDLVLLVQGYLVKSQLAMPEGRLWGRWSHGQVG